MILVYDGIHTTYIRHQYRNFFVKRMYYLIRSTTTALSLRNTGFKG